MRTATLPYIHSDHAVVEMLAETHSPYDFNPNNEGAHWWATGYDLALNNWFWDPWGYHREGAVRIYNQTYGSFENRDDHLRNAFDY